MNVSTLRQYNKTKARFGVIIINHINNNNRHNNIYKTDIGQAVYHPPTLGNSKCNYTNELECIHQLRLIHVTSESSKSWDSILCFMLMQLTQIISKRFCWRSFARQVTQVITTTRLKISTQCHIDHSEIKLIKIIRAKSKITVYTKYESTVSVQLERKVTMDIYLHSGQSNCKNS